MSSTPDMPFGAVLAEIMSEPGKASELPPEQTTESVLQSMLTENTGRHILDSGGAYGRAWEQNQDVDFDQRPETEANWRVYEAGKYSRREEGELELDFYATIDVYHFLKDRLDFDPEMEAKFDEFVENRPDSHWLEDMEAFAESRHSGGKYEDAYYTVNSYNHEDCLSQVIQYTVFQDHEDDEYYVLLQIHGGCDVRGGYTRPRVFRAWDMHPLYDNARIEVGCDGSGTPDHNPGQLDLTTGEPVKIERCGANWTDEGGNSWLYDGGIGGSDHVDLSSIEVERGTEGKVGILVVDEDEGCAFCPVCGKGKLEVYPPFPPG